MPIKVFISQPMAGKINEEIVSERVTLIDKARSRFGDVDVIESYMPGCPESKNEALYMLGKSLCKLSEADVAVFAKGWEDARGCRIENQAAIDYGLDVIEVY